MVVDVGDGVCVIVPLMTFCLRGELVQNDEIEAKLTFFYFYKIRLHIPSDPFRLFRPLRCEIRGDKKHTQLKEAKMIKSKCVYRGDSLLSVIS